jgi:hypothetical protein
LCAPIARVAQMDSILESITLKQLRALEDVLTNDENSSDEELHRYFIDELDLTDIQATQALTYRSLYLLNMYLQGHGPIFVGEDAMTGEMLLGSASAPRKPGKPYEPR